MSVMRGREGGRERGGTETKKYLMNFMFFFHTFNVSCVLVYYLSKGFKAHWGEEGERGRSWSTF